MSPWLKKLLWKPYGVFCNLFFDPYPVFKKYRALPVFLKNLSQYKKLNRNPRFDFQLKELWYCSQDRYSAGGTAEGHYFYQDLWAARTLNDRGVRFHVDVGSRVDGFVAHLLTFCHVCYVDIRPIEASLDRLEFREGSITQMPFSDGEVESLSSLHVIEHIGLGRYGDDIDPEGYLKAARELVRVLKPGGHLLLGTPVGRERLCYDAHRVFDPQTMVDALAGLDLLEFHLIDDQGKQIHRNASFDLARQCSYGCGLFVFSKKVSD